VQVGNNQNSGPQSVPRLNKSSGGKVPQSGLPADNFQTNGVQTKKVEAAMLRQSAIKGGKLVDINGEKRIQVGNDWYRPYVERKGYEENFLGTNVDLPTLDPSIKSKAAPRVDDPSRNELEYTNFSIVMNKERRMPFFTAVNIDGAQVKEVERSGKWLFDPRIEREHQLGNEAYKKNDWDRGHMVRRKDAVWGDKAAQGSTDTFVYTNAALQHKNLNQHEWLDLENRVLDKAAAEDKKMTVFTGPVFREDDPSFDNNGRMKNPAKIPQDFWKVVVWNDKEKGLQSEAFVMSQKKDLAGNSGPKEVLEKESEFAMYRVPLNQLEEMTNLHFGQINNDCTSCQRLDQRQPLSQQLG
jgi:endonuclease G